MPVVIAIVIVVGVLVAVGLFLRLRPQGSGGAPLTGLERAKALVANVESVQRGKTKEEVERLLGKADKPTKDEWLYNLDEHSGYVVSFDSTSRVERVTSWKS